MSLRCIVCDGRAALYFTKTFNTFGLGNVDYERCERCGLVMSATHFGLSDHAWADLNAEYHRQFFGRDQNADDPRWLERLAAQRAVIRRLEGRGALPTARPWVDYGCGDGKLADALTSDGLPTRKFDRYTQGSDHLASVEAGAFDVVINTSVMEHVRDRAALDAVAALPADSGVLALHTLVRGEVPPDPSWFYLLPVHTVFFTNNAMEILFREWGFEASLYSVEARMWFAYREKDELWRRAAATDDGETMIARDGFVAYWP